MINVSKSTNLSAIQQIAGALPSDNNVEFIGVRNSQEVLWLQNGTHRYFADLPVQHFTLLKKAYLKDHKAVDFLSKVTEDINRQIELYTYYLYGGVDSTPDISNGKLAPSENFRDTPNCPSLLWDSKSINIDTHELTPRQIVIVDLISKDLPNKAIAAALKISHKTLDFHLAKLFRAIGVSTKLALLAMCFQNQVVN